jgi:16S rRNA (adenine1518-N6/adenine1519-N6)-dimethyltransferase
MIVEAGSTIPLQQFTLKTVAQTKHEIQAILSQIGSAPHHRFGQNFMIDQNLVRIVADAGEIQAGDLVIEVGPGTGTLTEELLSRQARVLAVEIDRDLSRMLRERFAGESRFELIEGDALDGKHALNASLLTACQRSHRRDSGAPIKLVANLPYNIASPLVIELLIAGVELLAFTVQKEVADRLRAQAGSDAYGALSVMAQLLSSVEVLRTLPAQAFWPAPKIESALVRMRRHDQLDEQANPFGRFLHVLFSARRKTLRKALAQSGMLDVDAIFNSLRLDPKLRPENVSPGQLLQLYEALNRSTRAEE